MAFQRSTAGHEASHASCPALSSTPACSSRAASGHGAQLTQRQAAEDPPTRPPAPSRHPAPPCAQSPGLPEHPAARRVARRVGRNAGEGGKTSSENRQWRLAGTTVRPPSQPSSTGESSRHPCRPGKQPLVPLCTHQLNDCLGAQLRQLAHNSVQQRQQQPLVTVPAGSTGGVGLVPAGGEGRQRLQRGLMEARPARPAPASTGHGSGNSSSNSRASLPQLDDCCGDLAQAASIKGAGVLGSLQWGRKTEGRQAGRGKGSGWHVWGAEAVPPSSMECCTFPGSSQQHRAPTHPPTFAMSWSTTSGEEQPTRE